MNQNKDYDNKINEEELGSLKLKISPRRGLILTGIIFIVILIFGILVILLIKYSFKNLISFTV